MSEKTRPSHSTKPVWETPELRVIGTIRDVAKRNGNERPGGGGGQGMKPS